MSGSAEAEGDEAVVIDDYEAGELAVEFDDKEPEDLLEWAFERFHPRLAIVTSFQVDTLVLLDMARQINRDVRVITVDTGRLPQETHDLIDRIRETYGVAVGSVTARATNVGGAAYTCMSSRCTTFTCRNPRSVLR